MTNRDDRATAREEELRADAIAEQQRKSGLSGKTVADSAEHCAICEDVIPQARREAVPGVQTCIDCQTDLEKATN